MKIKMARKEKEEVGDFFEISAIDYRVELSSQGNPPGLVAKHVEEKIDLLGAQRR